MCVRHCECHCVGGWKDVCVCVIAVFASINWPFLYIVMILNIFPFRLLNSNRLSTIVNKPFRNLPRLVQLWADYYLQWQASAALCVSCVIKPHLPGGSYIILTWVTTRAGTQTAGEGKLIQSTVDFSSIWTSCAPWNMFSNEIHWKTKRLWAWRWEPHPLYETLPTEYYFPLLSKLSGGCDVCMQAQNLPN